MKVLFIDGKAVEETITMRDALEAVRAAFKEKGLGRVQMPAKSYVFFPKYNGDFRVMPAYIEESDLAGIKVVNAHPNNIKLGLPSVMATIVLLNPKTGAPKCIMNGTMLTAVRTGAAGGVAVEYLARPDSTVVGMIGAGTQARTQLIALAEVMKEVDHVKVFDINKERAERYAAEMHEKTNVDIEVTSSIKEAVQGSDIVVTVTPVREPIIKNEWIEAGMHVNAIGADAPGKEELDHEILKRAKIVVDDMEQAIHSGEVNIPISKGIIAVDDIYGTLPEVVAGLKHGRVSAEEVTIFDSTGTAIQDVATANIVFERVMERGAGVWLDF